MTNAKSWKHSTDLYRPHAVFRWVGLTWKWPNDRHFVSTPVKHPLTMESPEDLPLPLNLWSTHAHWSGQPCHSTGNFPPPVKAIKKAPPCLRSPWCPWDVSVSFSNRTLIISLLPSPTTEREYSSSELTRPYTSTHNKLYVLPLYQYMVRQQ